MKHLLATYFPKQALVPFCIGLLVSLYFLFFGIIGLNFEFLPGDLGDGRLNLYFLEHAYKFITGQLDSLWNAPFMYPEPNILAYSDNLLGSSPIYGFFRIIGFDIFTAYQCWYLSLTTLNYFTAYLLLMKIFKNGYSAVIGAIVFAFSIALISQVAHAQTFPRFPLPLIILMALKFSEDFKPSYFFVTIFLLVYQIYCGIYLGFMAAIPLTVILILLFIQKFKLLKIQLKSKKWILLMLGAIILNLLILLPLLYPYLQNRIAPTADHYLQIIQSVPTIDSHFYSHPLTLVWGILDKFGEHIPAYWDHRIFAGGIATISFIIALYFSFKNLMQNRFNLNKLPPSLILILVGLLTIIFYLRFDVSSLYYFLYKLPGFSSMRSMTRIINIELLFFAVATSFVFSKLIKLDSKYKFVYFFLALTLIVLDNSIDGHPSVLSKEIARERLEKMDEMFSRIPANAVVSYEPMEKDEKSLVYQIDAMLLSQKYNLKSINGYTATSPNGFYFYWKDIDENGRNQWIKESFRRNIQQNNSAFIFDSLYVITSPIEVQKISVEHFKN